MTIPLGLSYEISDGSGARYRWGANEPADSRPRNMSFRTKIGEGFSDASVQLARRIDRDYPDLDLINDVAFVGADGSIAYEGRMSAMPRELTDAHSIGVQFAGWMSHAKDRKFSEIYVDRDLGSWGPPSSSRRLTLMSTNLMVSDPSQATDPTNSKSGVSTAVEGAWASPYTPISEAWYDAGPECQVAQVGYGWQREDATTVSVAGTWVWRLASAAASNVLDETGANLLTAGPQTLQGYIPGAARRYAALQFFNTATPGGADGAHYGVGWYQLAVYGNHGLTLYTGDPAEPAGVRASDVIKNIAQRFCPRLDTSGVQTTSYVIPHLEFKEGAYPYDAFLEVNKYHLFHLGVWDNKTLVFRPYDFTDYTWEIRTDDPGTQFSPQGPSSDDLYNGVTVRYTDLLTGVKNVLRPDVWAELKDTSTTNPWNAHNVNHWLELELSSPTLAGQALQIGRAALAQANEPKAPGTIAVQGYIRDRGGVDQPVWKVRAGDTISVTNFPNDQPRLIHETDYDDETKTVTISVDGPAQALDAVFDRMGVALTAAGVGA